MIGVQTISAHLKKMYFCKVLSLFFFCGAAFAQTGKVLIVNTDNSVFRYEKIATEFKNALQLNAYKWTEFDLERHINDEEELKRLIQEDPPGLVFCLGSEAFLLADKLAHNKKMLFSGVINWQRLAIGEKTNGVANELSPMHELSLLHYFFPSIKNIGVVYSESFSLEYVENLKKTALPLGINVISRSNNGQDDINAVLTDLMPKIDMFWLIADPGVISGLGTMQQIFDTAKQYKKPVYAYSDVFIGQGAVLSISVDLATIGRQAAGLAIKMDMDDKAPSGVVQTPVGSTITLNKCVLDMLKLKFNPDALDSVNDIVGCGK